MKFLLMVFLSFQVCAATKSVVEQVHSMSLKNGEYTVTFWGNSRVFRLSENDKVAPCLENAVKAKMNVFVQIDSEKGQIQDCKLASKPLPGEQTKIKAQRNI